VDGIAEITKLVREARAAGRRLSALRPVVCPGQGVPDTAADRGLHPFAEMITRMWLF